MLGPKFDMTTFLATSSQNFGDLLFATFLVIFCHIGPITVCARKCFCFWAPGKKIWHRRCTFYKKIVILYWLRACTFSAACDALVCCKRAETAMFASSPEIPYYRFFLIGIPGIKNWLFIFILIDRQQPDQLQFLILLQFSQWKYSDWHGFTRFVLHVSLRVIKLTGFFTVVYTYGSRC